MSKTIIRDLGGGLILRHATHADTDELADFNAHMHMERDATEPDLTIDLWVRELMSGNHPTVEAEDFLVVEDTATHKIVSSSNTISQVWAYGGIPFKVGRPELVSTHPDYRNRGLVRAQFEELHRWSAERGEMVQTITGIPFYYRQFGYEMTLAMPSRRIGYKANIVPLKEGQAEPFIVRPATEDDLPLISRLYDDAMKRYLVTAVYGQDMWRYDLVGRIAKSVPSRALCVIETPEGAPVGCLIHKDFLYGNTLSVHLYELLPGMRWSAVTPSVLRYFNRVGGEYAERDKKGEFGVFMLGLGENHPVYDIIQSQIPRKPGQYCYFMRVPDLPAFLSHIAPMLEQRLAESAFASHTGTLKLNFYRGTCRLTFVEGKLTSSEQYKPAHQDDGDLFFPNLTFLHLLFGHRDFEEIQHIYSDCYAQTDEVRALVKTLFPRQGSLVMAIN